MSNDFSLGVAPQMMRNDIITRTGYGLQATACRVTCLPPLSPSLCVLRLPLLFSVCLTVVEYYRVKKTKAARPRLNHFQNKDSILIGQW